MKPITEGEKKILKLDQKLETMINKANQVLEDKIHDMKRKVRK